MPPVWQNVKYTPDSALKYSENHDFLTPPLVHKLQISIYSGPEIAQNQTKPQKTSEIFIKNIFFSEILQKYSPTHKIDWIRAWYGCPNRSLENTLILQNLGSLSGF